MAFDPTTAVPDESPIQFDPSTAKPVNSSTLRKAADLPLGFASGALGATRALSDAFGAGNVVSRGLKSAGEGVDSLLTPEAKAAQARQSAILEESKDKGFGAEVKAFGSAFMEAPAQATAQGLGSVVPMLATAAIPGALPARIAAGAMGAGMGVGTAKGAIRDEVEKRELGAGKTPDQAAAAADAAQAYSGPNTDQIALGGALGVADAAFGVAPAAVGMLRRKLGREAVEQVAGQAGEGIIKAGLKGAAKEMPVEFAQGGQEQVAANVAAQRAGYEAGTFDGAVAQGGFEALASAGPGAGFGILNRSRETPAAPPAIQPQAGTAEPAAPPAAPAGPSADAAAISAEQAGGLQRTFDPRAGVSPPLSLTPLNTEGGIPYEEPAPKPFGQNFTTPNGEALRTALPERPSVAMGLDPALGGLTAAAALAVDSGASPAAQGFGIRRRTADFTDVTPITAAAGQIETPRRLPFTNPGAPNGPQADQTISEEKKRQTTERKSGLSGIDGHSFGGQPIDLKNPDNRSSADAENFSYFASAQPLIEKWLNGVDPNIDALVQRQVTGAIKDRKVRDAIVELIPVDVVNVLRGLQLTPEMVLNNPSVLKGRGVRGDSDNSVAISINGAASIMKAVADVTAKNVPAGSNSGGGSVDVNPASQADKNPPVGIVGLQPFHSGRLVSAAAGSAAENVGAANNRRPSPSNGASTLTARDGNSQENSPKLTENGIVSQNAKADKQALTSEPRSEEAPAAGVSDGARPTPDQRARNLATLTQRMQAGRAQPPAADATGSKPVPPAQGQDVGALKDGWTEFPQGAGTLNVPRAEMPQVKTEHRGAMVNFLNARGVAHEQVEVDPASLKPTQAEFSQTKVQEAADRDTDRSILISSDGHIIDGHHQAIAKLQNGKPVRAIRLNATADELLPLVREFPSSTVDEASNVQNAPQPAAATQATANEASAPVADPKKPGGGIERIKQAAGVASAPPSAPTAPAAPKPDTGPELLGRNSQPFSEGGKPFKTEADAKAAKKLHPTKRVMKVKGGYALGDKTPKQIAADAAKAKRLRQFNSGTPGKPMSAHEFIVSEGGMSAAARSELGVDGNPRVGNRTLFAGQGKPGLTLEQAAMKLKQAGYITDESESAAADIIKRSLNNPQYTPEGVEAVAEAEREAEFQDYLNAAQEPVDENADDFDPFGPSPDFSPAELADAGYDEATAKIKAEVDALIAMAEAQGIDTETLREDAARATADQTEQEYYEQARSALNEAIIQGAASRGSDSTGRVGQGQQGEAQRGGGEDRVAPAGEQGGEGLTAPTRADIEAQQARAEQAGTLDQREQTRRESEVGDFSFMTGFSGEGRQDTTGDIFGGAPAVSANTVFTEDAAAAARARLKSKLGRLNSGLDPEMMMDGITLAGYHIEKGARTFSAYARAMVDDLGDGVKPYLQSWYMAVRADPRAATFKADMDKASAVEDLDVDAVLAPRPTRPPAAESDSTKAQAAKTLTESLYQAIRANQMPKDNPALKKLVEAFDGTPANQARMKQAQEELETAIAMMARELVAKNEGDRTTFDMLLRLYESQPNLNIRTSTSIANQAYSTPAPLAWLASRLAGVTTSTVAHEPTGGTGMLLIAADPKKAIVNELNDLRIDALKAQGFTPTQKDAATQTLVPDGTQPDALLTNPPFGSIKDAEGKPIKVKVDGFSLGQIDHLIAARALNTIKDEGRATLILGANKVAGGLSTDDRIFFNWLYSHYNVVGHFEVEGDLYNRQGAGWPVRVITINGRQKSDKFSPVAGTIQRVDNWNAVYEQFTQSLAASKDQSSVRAAPAADGARARPSSPAAAPSQTGEGRPAGGTRGTGNVAGAGARVVSDRAEPAASTVGNSPDEQRLNAQSFVPPTQPGQEPAGAARPEKPAGTAAVAEAQGNEFQSPYTPRSARKDEGVLIPANMAQPTQDALSRLEDEVGDIDEFARKELGYATVADLHSALMGLQVDSVATSIYQIKQGKAVVIADQTGIGKGRQAASIIRWAARQGMTPVFVSVKPSLFTDMYGDLADIGTNDVTPFIMNGDAWVAGEGGTKLFANKPGAHKRVIQEVANSGRLPAGSNALFMTYSQINVDNVQRRALMALAPNAVFVLDESHNAAGASSTGEFVIGALEAAKGVVYLSATYAKRPDNMPLYFKTDIGDAAADTEGLAVAMASGGLPLQTVVSNNLVKAGQMFRRERSYDGVSIASVFDSPNRALHERMSNEATKALRAIVSADRMFHEVYVKQLAESGATVIDSAGNQIEQSVQHTEFSSVVHNFVKQMLLGLKAQSAADEAIASLKRGEKPIIAVENTMGSFLNEYAAANGIGQGESLGSFDYRTVLTRALARSRVVIEVAPNGDKVKRPVRLDQLDPMTQAAYRQAQAVIDGLTLDIPVSPIDWMRAEIIRAGYKVAEITGRNLSVDYGDPKKPMLSAIDATEQKDKVNTTHQFNSGNLDALILNVAGSTGISLHASEKFDDQRQRHMIVAQAAGDINIFMQMLGRVHRTGQVRLPKYTILSVDLPTEKRPTAVLSIKMKSLNANTSSNTESATSVKSSDILNKYGDQIVNQYLRDNYELARALDLEQEIGDDPTEDIARKATGRLALQPIATQHAFYDEVEAQYTALIDYLNKTNQNDLEPRTFDFDAKETRQEVLFEGPNKNTPFGEDAIYGEYSIKAQGTPMKPAEIRATMAENLDGLTPAAHAQKMLDDLDAKYQAFYATLEDGSKEAAANVRNIGRNFLSSHKIGATFRVDINSEPFNAVVLNVRNTHKETGNPYSMSKIQVSVAVNGALRSLSVPATQFSKIEVSGIAPMFQIEQLFKEQPPNQRETAKIVTGNLLAAYGELQGVRGTIITFTKQDGTSEQGILLPKLFDYSKNTRGDYRLQDGAAALKFLQRSENKDIGRFGIMTRDGNVRVLPSGQGIRVQVPKSKLKGAKYFLDKGLIEVGGDFVTQGAFMVSTVQKPSDAMKMLDLLMKKQALYALPSMAEEAKTLTGDKTTPAFSRGTPAQGIPASAAKQITDAIRARWANAPEIVVAANMQDQAVPERVRQEDAKQRSQGASGEPEGFYYGGKVYLVASALKKPTDVVRVLFHESLGHAGLRGVFGESLTPILKQLAVLRRADVAAKASEYGLNMSTEAERLQAAEEVLAVMAETKPELGYVQRAIAAIRAFMRKHIPGFGKMMLTDAEIINSFILPARRFVERGPGGGPRGGMPAPAFSRTDNGTMTEDQAIKAGFTLKAYRGVSKESPFNDSGTTWLTTSREVAEAYAEEVMGYDDPGVLEVMVKPDGLQRFDASRLTDEQREELGADDFGNPQAMGIYDRSDDHPLGGSRRNVTVIHAPREAVAVLAGQDDIRFSRSDAGTAGVADLSNDTWTPPMPSKWDDYVFQLQDKNIDLKRVTQAITEWSGKLADNINVYLQEELYHGRTAKRVQEFSRLELEPALRQLAADGYQLSDLEEYLHARHAKEANRVIAERNPTQAMIDAARAKAKAEVERLELALEAAPAGMRKALKDQLKKAKDERKRWRGAAAFKGTEAERLMLSGMSDAAADAYFAQLPQADKDKLGAVAAQFDKIMDETSRLMVEYELESQDTVDSWAKMYQHYIPLQREDKDGGSRGTGQGFSIKGRETKGRTGSTRKVVDIVANIANAREKAVVRGEKNRVAQALVGMVAANPNEDFWKVGPPEYERVFNPATGKVENRINPAYKSLPNVVIAKVAKDGMVKEVAVTFSEDDERAVRMAGALKNLDTPQIEGWLGNVSKITRYFASINTQYNPIFGVVNLVRDIQGAAINLAATPLADKKMEVSKDAVRALAGIYQDIRATRKGGVASSKWSKLYEQFQHDGGQTGFRNMFETSADRTADLTDKIDPEAWAKSDMGKFFSANGQLVKPMNQIRKGTSVIFDWLSDYNEAMENGVRLAAYKAALDKGMSRQQAASLAKNLTVNFNRKGLAGNQAGAVYAFFNAAMQGTARIGQALTTMDPGKPSTIRLSPLGKKIVYGGMLLGSMQALALAGAGFGDDEPPDFVREKNLVIPTGGKTYISIPMPLGLHVIPSLGRIATEFALGGFENPVQRATQVAGLFADAFNPIGNAGMSMQTLAPTVLDPFVALTENKDYTGKPIARVAFNKDLPGFSQHKDSASIISKFLAEAINTLSGGNEYVAGVFSPTPDQIDYLAGQLGGGVWRELSKLEQTATGTVTGEDTPIYKVPLVGRFVGSAAGQAGEGNKFYSNANKLNRLETEIKGLMKDGKTAEAAALRAENPEARLIVRFNMVERQVQKLRRQKSELIKTGDQSDQVRVIERRITDLMANMNRVIGEIEASQ